MFKVASLGKYISLANHCKVSIDLSLVKSVLVFFFVQDTFPCKLNCSLFSGVVERGGR